MCVLSCRDRRGAHCASANLVGISPHINHICRAGCPHPAAEKHELYAEYSHYSPSSGTMQASSPTNQGKVYNKFAILNKARLRRGQVTPPYRLFHCSLRFAKSSVENGLDRSGTLWQTRPTLFAANRNMRLASLEGDSPRGGEMSRSDRGDRRCLRAVRAAD